MCCRKFLILCCWMMMMQAVTNAQTKPVEFSSEISFVTENDNYNFTKHDRYYTNGLFVKYHRLQNKQTGKSVKTINRFEAGQLIFNSYSNRRSAAEVLTKLDRPYTGWLYASAGKTNIFKNGHVLMYDLSVGILGPGAGGKQVQTGYHKFIGLYKVYGWEYQLQNEVGVNASVQYYYSLVKSSATNRVSLHAVGKAVLGNTFTNASAGMLLKFGKINPGAQSAYWSGQLGGSAKQQHSFETIFFLEPLIMAQAYNATVQGGLLRNDKGYYVSPLNPLMYVVKGGAIFSWRQTAFSIVYTVKQREAKSMIDKAEVYGAFGFTFRFR